VRLASPENGILSLRLCRRFLVPREEEAKPQKPVVRCRRGQARRTSIGKAAKNGQVSRKYHQLALASFAEKIYSN